MTRNRKPSYFRYKGRAPVFHKTFEHTKQGVEIGLFVWKDAAELIDLTTTKRTKRRNRVAATFNFRNDDKASRWLGDICFYRGGITPERIAHEAVHATQWHFRRRGRALNGRNEELFCEMVGSLVKVMTDALIGAKLL